MCFTNHKTELDKLRARKRPITVWKTGSVSDLTGRVVTLYHGNRVEWILGQVVRPHKIRKPLRDKDSCTAGLYFHWSVPPKQKHGLVVATVKPEDIIAVSSAIYCDSEIIHQQICTVAATVIKAPNPDQAALKIQRLIAALKHGKQQIKSRERQMEEWAERREDELEALQAMKDQIVALKETKHDR